MPRLIRDVTAAEILVALAYVEKNLPAKELEFPPGVFGGGFCGSVFEAAYLRPPSRVSPKLQVLFKRLPNQKVLGKISPLVPYFLVVGFRVKPIEMLFRFLDLDRRYYGEIDLSGPSPASGF
jgi:hypothetical protein